MSQWVHVCGCLQLSASAFNSKTNKQGKTRFSLPYPDEQFILGIPEGCTDKDGNSYALIPIYEYSLPRVRPIIDKLVQNIMPKGELGFCYYLNQDKFSWDVSSSDFHFRCEINLFKKKVLALYNNTPTGHSRYASFKDLDVGADFIRMNDSFTMTFDDHVRYCSGVRFMRAMEQLLAEFDRLNIGLDGGYVEWRDDYGNDFVYSVRADNEELIFSISNKKGKTLAKKVLAYKDNGERFVYELKKQTANWANLESRF